MDEMASYEATIKSRNVNGAYGLGFTRRGQKYEIGVIAEDASREKDAGTF